MIEQVGDSSGLIVGDGDPSAANVRAVQPPHHTHVHRLDYLDVVRGIAAMSVLVFHYLTDYHLLARRGLARTPLSLFWDGNAAVAMFFVLSGLVLSLRYFRTPRQPPLGRFSFGSFVVSRVCRIQLPFLVALIAITLVHRFAFARLATTPSGGNVWLSVSSAHQLIRQAILLNPTTQIEVPQAWTLSIELVISLLVPAMVLVASESTVWLLGMAAVWAIASPAPGFFGYAVHFALGVALARHREDLICLLNGRLMLRLLLLLVGLSFYTINDIFPPDPGNWPWAWWWSEYLPGFGSAILLAFIFTTPAVQRMMSVFWLRHLGRISYSLYLLHFAVLMVLTPRYLAWTSGLPSRIWWASGLAFTIICSLILSDIFYRFVEVPSVAFGKRVVNHLPVRARL